MVVVVSRSDAQKAGPWRQSPGMTVRFRFRVSGAGVGAVRNTGLKMERSRKTDSEYYETWACMAGGFRTYISRVRLIVVRLLQGSAEKRL